MLKSVKDESVTPTRIDICVAKFIIIREEIERREEKHKAELRGWRDRKDKLEGELLEMLETAGMKSAKTVNGTVTIKVTPYASCSDPDLFVTYVRENDAYELMDRRANATACLGYAEEHEGQLPPGVKVSHKRTIGVTRA